ncbi:MAG: hypothetical protein KDB27_04575, partial [Planctomycetales bacterium]|nr:hypothetical protein [Planctomycetales bacterium]
REAVRAINGVPSQGRRQLLLMRAGLIEDDWLLHDRGKSEWKQYSQLPIQGLYQIDQSRVEVASLSYTDAGKLRPDVAAKLQEREIVWMLVRGRKSAQRIVVEDAIKSLSSQFEVVDTRQFGSTLGLFRLRRTTSGDEQ